MSARIADERGGEEITIADCAEMWRGLFSPHRVATGGVGHKTNPAVRAAETELAAVRPADRLVYVRLPTSTNLGRPQ
jgi:hypothetical protein